MTETSAATAVQIPRAGRYDIDPQGSTVAFTARHLFGLARVQGTITVRRGGIDVADPVGHSGVHVELDAASTPATATATATCARPGSWTPTGTPR
jgi:polyisoprenoid-binding protein YceI